VNRMLVAGVVTLRVARNVGRFPVPFVAKNTRPGRISMRLAGTGWTAARTLQRLGTEVTFATYVGADQIGQFTAQGLLRHGLYGPATLVCEEHPRAMVLYDADGRRSGASDLRSTPFLRYPPALARSIMDNNCTAAILTNIGFARSLIPIAIELGIPFATDLHMVDSASPPRYRDWMAAAHILACSHEELPEGPEHWIRSVWRNFGTEIVLVGCGADGALLGVRAGKSIWKVRSHAPRGVRFVAGAGDLALATFVHHYFAHGDPLTSARMAMLAAGWKVGGEPDEEPGVGADHLAELRLRHGLPSATRWQEVRHRVVRPTTRTKWAGPEMFWRDHCAAVTASRRRLERPVGQELGE
jgi:acarbose 7IV-phosphotransferase